MTFFLIGGVQESLLLHWKSGNTGQILMSGIFCACAAGIYFQRRKTLRFLCRVELLFQGRKTGVSAFWDSGNHLCEPESGAPVCILEEEVWQKFTGDDLAEGLIRYRTVSGHEQTMKLVTPDEMDIYQVSGIRKIKKPKIGLAPGILMQHPRAQMLLHNFYME